MRTTNKWCVQWRARWLQLFGKHGNWHSVVIHEMRECILVAMSGRRPFLRTFGISTDDAQEFPFAGQPASVRVCWEIQCSVAIGTHLTLYTFIRCAWGFVAWATCAGATWPGGTVHKIRKRVVTYFWWCSSLDYLLQTINFNFYGNQTQ